MWGRLSSVQFLVLLILRKFRRILHPVPVSADVSGAKSIIPFATGAKPVVPFAAGAESVITFADGVKPVTSFAAGAKPVVPFAAGATSSIPFTVASAVETEWSSLNCIGDKEAMFDSFIADSDLVNAVESASQAYKEELAISVTSLAVASAAIILDDDLVAAVETASQAYEQEPLHVTETNKLASDKNVLQHSDADMSDVVTAVTRTLQSMNFGKLDDCMFNFYFNK